MQLYVMELQIAHALRRMAGTLDAHHGALYILSNAMYIIWLIINNMKYIAAIMYRNNTLVGNSMAERLQCHGHC